jgi:DNA modification methylase
VLIAPRKRYITRNALPDSDAPPSRLLYGDNLTMLKDHVADDSVDLVYLDPPYNSKRSYNMLFKEPSGQVSPAQFQVFTDTWNWGEASIKALDRMKEHGPLRIRTLLPTLCDILQTNPMSAYLVMMTERLLELHRVLKSTGTLYLHCDPSASHYLKLVLDAIFGPQRFLNEISWKRSSAHNDTTQGMSRYGRIRDVILVYTKSAEYTWNPMYTDYSDDYLAQEYRHLSPEGRSYKETDVTAAKPGGDTDYEWRVKRRAERGQRWCADLDLEYLHAKEGWEYAGVRPYRGRSWAFSKANMADLAREGRLIHRETGMPRLIQFADEMPGVALQDHWDDILPVSGKESLGFATQKPLALLERIVQASSKPGDVVLDPFCGCGTAIVAAEKHGRQWIGIDVTTLAISVIEGRLADLFEEPPRYTVTGLPHDESGARRLRDEGRHQFEWWATSLLKAVPVDGHRKKGADRGIDGVITFYDPLSPKPKLCLVQVKSGHVQERDIRDLRGTVANRDGAEVGVFVTLEKPTRPMVRAAREGGVYSSEWMGRDYARIQILTIEDLLSGRRPDLPPQVPTTRPGPRFSRNPAEQQRLPEWG